jgi:hypothetical protein
MSKAVTLLLALVAAVVVTVVIDLLITGKPVKRCKKMEIVSQSNSNTELHYSPLLFVPSGIGNMIVGLKKGSASFAGPNRLASFSSCITTSYNPFTTASFDAPWDAGTLSIIYQHS